MVVRQILINSELRELAEDFDRARAAVQSYRDRFGYLPGDDINTTSRWGEAVPTGNANGRIDGEWLYTGAVDLAQPGTLPETRLMWMHLRRARMWHGVAEDKRALGLPANAAGGFIGVQNDNFGLMGPVVCLSSLDGESAAALDRQLDDGRPDSGHVRAARQPTARVAVGVYGEQNGYYLCRGL